VRFKKIGCFLQAMVNVNGPYLSWPALRANPQQSGGVGATAQCNGQWELGLKAWRKQCRASKRRIIC
jgi:hypothetical protein